MDNFEDERSYLEFLRREVTLPDGFRAASVPLSFTPQERPSLEPYRMNLNALVCDEPTDAFAGVFTRNAIVGDPVLIGRERLLRETTRGVLVNNKISNVCAPDGRADALTLTSGFASQIGAIPEDIFPASTGIIGWKLPVAEMSEQLPALSRALSGDSVVDFASGIMTTDSFAKVRSVRVGDGSVVGIAKGAGMIEPNMATMLAFVLTDLDVDRNTCRSVLPEAVEQSFNSISIDSDQSTSDMTLLFASRQAGCPPYEEFSDAVREVCMKLAEDIVRNGEGTAHVIRVDVDGCDSDRDARMLGKAVVNSPLVKTAIYGNDPNVGRIVGALGDCAGSEGIRLAPDMLTVSIGDVRVFDRGVFSLDREKEIQLSSYLKRVAMNPRLRGYPQHYGRVDIHVSCGKDRGSARVSGSDLSDEYVHENADYRS